MRKILLSLLTGSLLVSFAFAGTQDFTPADKVTVPATVKVSGTPVSQGGDTMGDAALVFGLPFYACGTTVGYTDDYDEVCNYSGSTAPDVVYTFAPSADMFIDATLCEDNTECLTTYDTKLYIYDGAGALVACNDDNCASIGYPYSYVSALDGVELFAGSVYYIIVDGYGGEEGNYALNIVEADPPPPPPEDEVCPEGTIFGQTPVGPDGSWSFTTSDAPLGYKVADNFWDVFEPICDLHWWGLLLIYDAGWNLCFADPMPFLVEFWYSLDEGPICTYQAMVTPVDTGILYAGFYPMYYFSIDLLDPCCFLENGWVTIQSLDGCAFLWAKSEFGDGFGQQWQDGVWVPVLDMAFCLTFGDEPTEIQIPQSIELNQNYPNPFNPTTTIEFSLTQPEQVNLSVYNLTGELVATLVDGEVAVGSHSATFDATNLPSGVYFYTMTAGDFVQTNKMVLVK